MNERWLEISVRVDPEAADDVRAAMARLAGQAVAIEETPGNCGEFSGPAVVRAYIPDGRDCETMRLEILSALWHLGSAGSELLYEPFERWITSSDYLEAWRQFYQPLPLGHCFIVVPSWSDPPVTERMVVRLDPGMAFGTGLHPSTRLVAEALENVAGDCELALDVGTGSGILAIIAALRGVGRVTAYDTDADAVRTASANVALNDLEEVITVTSGNLPAVAQLADVLVANIVAGTHLEQMPIYRQAVRKGGHVILGGILSGSEELVIAAANGCGLSVEDVQHSDDWVAVMAVADRNEVQTRSMEESSSIFTMDEAANAGC